MNPISIRKACIKMRAPIVASVGSAFLFAACASTPPPTVAMKAAEQAIAVADQARIADAASPELNEAREKLAAAEDAVHDKHMITAERLATESRADAELASAKTEASKARAVNDEMRRSNATLALEMQRNSGVK